MRVASLFSGAGGFDLGFAAAGHEVAILCENAEPARRALAARFPGVELAGDVRDLCALPACDVIAAGFPCQDLSLAGLHGGIAGPRSGLVGEVFRLVAESRPEWIVLENVPFMLALHRGAAMRLVVDELVRLGYAWAYRVVDTRAFGLPQRRCRVVVVAARTGDPTVLLSGGESEPPERRDRPPGTACGFYWTEGRTGLGWAVDAVPTLRVGSGLGIPSPPAVLTPDDRLVVPGITDAERLQGFPAGWTEPAGSLGDRWRLVGNAVSVPVAAWVARILPGENLYDPSGDVVLEPGGKWPDAAHGRGRDAWASPASARPVFTAYQHLDGFLRETRPLSARAAAGFLRRLDAGRMRRPPGLAEAARRCAVG